MCGVPYVASVYNIRAKIFLRALLVHSRGGLVVLQNVLPPLARLHPARNPDHQSNRVKANIRAAIQIIGDNFLSVPVCGYVIRCRFLRAPFPEVGTVAQYMLPRASCSLSWLALRTPMLKDLSRQ